MIKTVSFAPSRSARAATKVAGKSSSKAATAQPARAPQAASDVVSVAEKPAKTQLAPTTSGSSSKSANGAETAPTRRRAVVETPIAPVEKTVVKTRAAKVAPAKSAESEAVLCESVAPAKKAPAKRTARKSEDVALDFSDETEVEIEAPVSATPAAATAPVVAPRIKKVRAPKDLAAQYGATPDSEVVPRVVAEKAAPRKRLTRAAKEARSQMLRPDDGVLQRLQQANAIEVKKPASRGRGWEFECGRCGRISRFQTPGAICECGAIAVRE